MTSCDLISLGLRPLLTRQDSLGTTDTPFAVIVNLDRAHALFGDDYRFAGVTVLEIDLLAFGVGHFNDSPVVVVAQGHALFA